MSASEFAEAASQIVGACRDLPMKEAVRQLAGGGLLGMLAPEDVGGLGLGLVDATGVVEATGLGMLMFPLIEGMVAASALARSRPDLAAALVTGERIATIAWSGVLERLPSPALDGTLGQVQCLAASDLLLAPWRDRTGAVGLAVIDLAGTRLAVAGTSGLDQERPFSEVTLEAAAIPPEAVIAIDGLWESIEGAATVLRGAEMLGTARAAFRDATRYVQDRQQFGKPLSAFQTVKHRLARDHVGLLNTERALATAAAALDAGAPEASVACLVAGSIAGDHCRHAAESAMHLHGAIGHTKDLPLHRYLRRIHALAEITRPAAMRGRLAERLLDGNKAWMGGVHPALAGDPA